MCFFVSLVPATIWLIIGYFVLFASSRSEAGIKIFGSALAIWIFVIAAMIPIAAAYVTIAGLCPLEDMLRTMNSTEP
jgi:hypothetical protein